jgi:hypothetical protein
MLIPSLQKTATEGLHIPKQLLRPKEFLCLLHHPSSSVLNVSVAFGLTIFQMIGA